MSPYTTTSNIKIKSNVPKKKYNLCVWYKNKTSFGAADLGEMLRKCSQESAVKILGSRPERIS